MKKMFLTMTALSAIFLVSPALNENAVAGQNFPMVLVKPQVKVEVDTKRLAKKPGTRRDRSNSEQSDNQQQMAAKPRSFSRPTAMVAPPLPRLRPDTPIGASHDGSLDHVLDLVGLWSPVGSERDPEAYNEFEEDDDSLGGGVDATGALGPDLPVPEGLAELFDITTNPNDLNAIAELEELRAIGDIARAGGIDPFDDPASALRQGRFGVGMNGAPNYDESGLDSGGKDSNGWTLISEFYSGNTSGRLRSRPSTYGTEYQTIVLVTDGVHDALTISTWTPGPNKTTTDVTMTARFIKGTMQSTQVTDSDGFGTVYLPPSESEEDGESEAGETGSENDNEGNDNEDVQEDTKAGGGDQGGNDTPGNGGCIRWTSFGGCMATRTKIWDSTSQPDPTEDGSGTVRSAGASIGPEAVTNGGDGSFGVEGGSGSGGFKLDPCATAGDDCGNGPGGPGNPVAGQRPD